MPLLTQDVLCEDTQKHSDPVLRLLNGPRSLPLSNLSLAHHSQFLRSCHFVLVSITSASAFSQSPNSWPSTLPC